MTQGRRDQSSQWMALLETNDVRRRIADLSNLLRSAHKQLDILADCQDILTINNGIVW